VAWREPPLFIPIFSAVIGKNETGNWLNSFDKHG
jgi:hypothetical protein